MLFQFSVLWPLSGLPILFYFYALFIILLVNLVVNFGKPVEKPPNFATSRLRSKIISAVASVLKSKRGNGD